MMARKDQITVTDLLAELEALRPQANHNKTCFTAQMDRALLRARAGDRPIPWHALSAWWRARGWPGWSMNTLRARWRELIAKTGGD